MSMTVLTEALKQARVDLLGGAWSEAAISDGPVKRLLHALGWDVFDPHSVKPEFSVGPGRVDFALKSAPAKIDVFLEIKAPGKADTQADQQLFQYTVHHGVPLACLTDGRVWSFYLPGGQGSYEDRRLYRLDLVERELDEACQRLERYLGRANVASGRFVEFAQSDYQDKARQHRLERALPQVWQRLLSGPDELLCDLLAESVEQELGERPSVQSVERFLRAAGAPAGAARVPLTAASVAPVVRSTEPLNRAAPSAPRIGFSINRQAWRECQSAKSCYVELLRALHDGDAGFAERFAHAGSGRKRAWIARTREELFPGRPDFQQAETSELGGGWFAGTQESASEFSKRAHVACAAAGLELGKDVMAVFSKPQKA